MEDANDADTTHFDPAGKVNQPAAQRPTGGLPSMLDEAPFHLIVAIQPT
jgi:hypothetical protein